MSDERTVGYMCLTDYEDEMGESDEPVTVYPTIELLRRHRKCVARCGIAEVDVRLRRVVEVQQP